MINKFLGDFYKTISFECGESFKSEKFKKFFLPNAVLMEKNDGKYAQKTIDEHIAEFDVAIRDYPHLFVKGFHEVQTDYSIIENEDCILVSSKYKKNYCRNGENITEYGTNNMIIVRFNNEYKIASILW